MDGHSLCGMCWCLLNTVCASSLTSDKLAKVFHPTGNIAVAQDAGMSYVVLCRVCSACFVFTRISEMMKLVLSVYKQFQCPSLLSVTRFHRFDFCLFL